MYLVGFIIRIYHDARLPVRQILRMSLTVGVCLHGCDTFVSVRADYP